MRAAALGLVVALGAFAGPPPAPPALGVGWAPVDSLAVPGLTVWAGVSESAPLRAWAVRLDRAALDVVVDSARGPSVHVGEACAAINGGYFTMSTGQPLGLAVDGGAVRSAATRTVTRGGEPVPVARGAVGVRGGSVEIGWASMDGEAVCRRDAPDGPCRPWPVAEAVGAGPVLIRGGRAVVTDREERFGATSIPGRRHPRSAVGIDRDGRVWLVVVDGRQDASRGATLGELALLMRSLGAVDALNLDGGGSSALVVRPPGGAPVRLNRPTGYDVERPVPTALVARCR